MSTSDEDLQRCLDMSLMSDNDLIQKALSESMEPHIRSEQDKLYEESLKRDQVREKKQQERIKRKREFDNIYHQQTAWSGI